MGIYLNVVDHCNISNNNVTSNYYGIYLSSSSNNNLTNNLIRNNGHGVYLRDSNNNRILENDILNNTAADSGIHLESSCSGNVIHYNNIVGNSEVAGNYGVYNGNTIENVNATNNWWGDPRGPGPVGPGSGDNVSANVTYDPWLNQSSHVTTFERTTTATNTGTASFQTTGGAITDLTAVDEATLPPDGKPNLVFPHGFFSFNITGLTPNQTVNVTITLPENVPVGTEYWKYHASEGGWIQIPIMGSNDGDNEIAITLQDGGLGDDDWEANGIIVDQGGPGNPPPVPVPVPEYSPIGLAALIGILSVVLAVATMRREE